MNTNKSLLLSVLVLAALAFGLSQSIRLLNPQPAARTNFGPLYDATGVREAAIVYPKDPQLSRPLAYDATAAMLEAITPKKIAPAHAGPVYDATGTMLENVVFP